MNIQPLYDRVLIEQTSAETKTAGGIIIPEIAQKKPTEGIVVAIGKEVKDVKKNDKVIFSKYSGSEIKVDGKTYVIVKETDIMGVYES